MAAAGRPGRRVTASGVAVTCAGGAACIAVAFAGYAAELVPFLALAGVAFAVDTRRRDTQRAAQLEGRRLQMEARAAQARRRQLRRSDSGRTSPPGQW